MRVWEFDAKSFPDTLKELRQEKKLKQGQLADLANVNVTTIVNYENGYKVPTFPILIKLSAVLGIDEIRVDTSKKWTY